MGLIDTAKDTGLPVRKLIDNDLSSLVSYVDYVMYDEDDMSDYKDNFNYLVEEKTLYNCKFNDNEWYFKDLEENNRRFIFDYEYNSRINNSLKAFVVVFLYDKRFSPNNVSAMFGLIKKIILITNNFSEKNLCEFEKELINTPTYQKKYLKTTLTYYLAFVPSNNIEPYWKILQQIKIEENRNARQLPPYNSILRFDAIINDLNDLYGYTVEERRKYFPLIIFWKLTCIIPIRPTEFLKLKKTSFYNDNGLYFIEIERIKRPPNPLSKRRKIPLETKLELDQKTYDLIQEYICLTKNNKTEYLLSVEEQSKYFRNSHLNKDDYTLERLNKDMFNTLLNSFYKEIIEAKESIKVVNFNDDITENNKDNVMVKIRMGDTRHLAFCSMLLQGLNPLTIARIGGHESIESQLHYHQHLDTFIDANTHTLSRTLSKRIVDFMRGNTDHVGEMFSFRELKLKGYSLYKAKGISPRKIDIYNCYSECFPFECGCYSCINCNYSEIDYENQSYNKIGAILQSELNKTEKDLKVKISLLSQYYQTSFKDDSINISKLLFNNKTQEDFIRLSSQIETVKNNKALIEAHLELLRRAELSE